MVRIPILESARGMCIFKIVTADPFKNLTLDSSMGATPMVIPVAKFLKAPPPGGATIHAPRAPCSKLVSLPLISRQLLDSDCRPAGRLHADSELTRLTACSIEISVMHDGRSECAEND